MTRSAERDYAAIAHRYAKDVVAGKIPACQQVIKACRRHLSDLQRSRWEENLRFVYDVEAGARFCRFAESFPHVKGRWVAAGECIRLEPWQVFAGMSIFGWIERDNPRVHRFRVVLLMLPRKMGKSVFDALVQLYKFGPESEPGAEVYFGATSEEHANDVGFKPARMMALKTPAYCKAFGITVNKNSLEKADGSVMKALIAKPGEGGNPSSVAVEEYHEHASDYFFNAMETGMGAREDPLIFIPTTAGYDTSSPCHALQKDMEKILDGLVQDERRFALIYTTDIEDDWTSVEALLKANPNCGVSVDFTWLREQQLAAISTPRKRAAFKTKHLNMWSNEAVSWMDMARWAACADANLKIDDFLGEECWAALDLADCVDFADRARVFRRELQDGPHFYAFATHYLNEERIAQPENQHYRDWEAAGWIVSTPGNITSYPRIADDIVQDTSEFTVVEVPHDPHHASPLVQFIGERKDWDQSAEFVKILPSYENFSPAMKELEAAVFAGRFHHQDDPVLNWMMSNVVCKKNRGGNLYPEKQSDDKKIDGAAALLMAFLRASQAASTWTDTEVKLF